MDTNWKNDFYGYVLKRNFRPINESMLEWNLFSLLKFCKRNKDKRTSHFFVPLSVIKYLANFINFKSTSI